jgi:hypothetical protein
MTQCPGYPGRSIPRSCGSNEGHRLFRSGFEFGGFRELTVQELTEFIYVSKQASPKQHYNYWHAQLSLSAVTILTHALQASNAISSEQKRELTAQGESASRYGGNFAIPAKSLYKTLGNIGKRGDTATDVEIIESSDRGRASTPDAVSVAFLETCIDGTAAAGASTGRPEFRASSRTDTCCRTCRNRR